PARSSHGPLPRGHLLGAPRVFGEYRIVRRLYAVACAFGRGLEPCPWFHFLCPAATRPAGLGHAQPIAHLGLDADARLEYAIELFLRVQNGISLQRRQSSAATRWPAEFYTISRLRQLEFGPGEEIWLPLVCVCGTNGSGTHC